MRDPTVAASVVMSVYNSAEYLSDAIESILAQTVDDFEFIVIDDGSADESSSILRTYESSDPRIRLFTRTHTGLTQALNEGVARSKGRYVIRMDADDIAEPDRFERQLNFMDADPGCAAIGCRLTLIDPDGDSLSEYQPPESHDDILESLRCGIGAIPHPAAVIRRDRLIDVGAYREKFTYAQDLDLWLRLAEVGRLANLSLPLLRYRLHCDSITLQRREEQLACARQAVLDAYERNGETLPEDLVLPAPETQSVEMILRTWAMMALSFGNIDVARKHVRRALQTSPFSVSNLKLATKVLLRRHQRRN